MVKKKVPDWLNSSLWSTTPTTTTGASSDERSQRHASMLSSTTDPPIPVPPPAAVIREESKPHPLKPEVKDHRDSRNSITVHNRNNGNNNNNRSSCGTKDEDSGDNGSPSVTGPSAEDISRQAQLLTALSRKVVNMGELRRIVSQGIPDGAGIRSTVWKLLLGYLPPDRSLWSTELAKKRSQYKHFKEELLMNPSEITRRMEKSLVYNHDDPKSESTGMLSRSEITHGEHPLSLGKSSIWNQFFQDSEIIEQIDRDVKRTHPDMHFFCGDSSFAKSNQEALKSILIVFAKLNPGIRYVQGMNEILAPLFYVFRNDPDEEMAACSEADTFFCFVELLSGFRDHFCQQLDNSVVGIRSTITKLSQLLKEHDEELWRHLEITTKARHIFTA
uniref:Rab-GAP TBC domain-containing protein n=1 Tax=Rhizophora mucronata TaxID=61149 RepID=A0A2P2JTJ1_RHIMU